MEQSDEQIVDVNDVGGVDDEWQYSSEDGDVQSDST